MKLFKQDIGSLREVYNKCLSGSQSLQLQARCPLLCLAPPFQVGVMTEKVAGALKSSNYADLNPMQRLNENRPLFELECAWSIRFGLGDDGEPEVFAQTPTDFVEYQFLDASGLFDIFQLSPAVQNIEQSDSDLSKNKLLICAVNPAESLEEIEHQLRKAVKNKRNTLDVGTRKFEKMHPRLAADIAFLFKQRKLEPYHFDLWEEFVSGATNKELRAIIKKSDNMVKSEDPSLLHHMMCKLTSFVDPLATASDWGEQAV